MRLDRRRLSYFGLLDHPEDMEGQLDDEIQQSRFKHGKHSD